MTAHIESKKDEIAKTVIMPGDPLRCKMIAEEFLDDYKLVNDVRNVLAYTGFYKGKMITVFASGMGIPSMGIYSYELFNDYNVENIIRVGTCGTYTNDLSLNDLVIADNSYSTSDYLYDLCGDKSDTIKSNDSLNSLILDSANELGLDITKCNVHCTEVFYSDEDFSEIIKEKDLKVCEMETFSLFSNAKHFNRSASAIFTVSDNLVTGEKMSSEEREKSLKDMIKLALESAIKA